MNGYMSAQTNKSKELGESFGIPYHSKETFIVEAPDYGHETTSEAMSYIVWMAAMHDVINGEKSAKDIKKESSFIRRPVTGCKYYNTAAHQEYSIQGNLDKRIKAR